MTTKVNWDEAPDGATHYCTLKDCANRWLKDEGDHILFYIEELKVWVKYDSRSNGKNHISMSIESVKFDSQMKIDDKPAQKPMHELYPKYYRDVSKLESVDYYRLVDLFGITDANVAHSFKKLLLAGNRTGNKSFRDDIIEARDTLNRRIEMWAEDDAS